MCSQINQTWPTQQGPSQYKKRTQTPVLNANPARSLWSIIISRSPNHFKILYRKRLCPCRVLGEIPYWLDNRTWCYRWTRFREISLHMVSGRILQRPTGRAVRARFTGIKQQILTFMSHSISWLLNHNPMDRDGNKTTGLFFKDGKKRESPNLHWMYPDSKVHGTNMGRWWGCGWGGGFVDGDVPIFSQTNQGPDSI